MVAMGHGPPSRQRDFWLHLDKRRLAAQPPSWQSGATRRPGTCNQVPDDVGCKQGLIGDKAKVICIGYQASSVSLSVHWSLQVLHTRKRSSIFMTLAATSPRTSTRT